MHVFGFIFDFSFFLRFIFTAIAVSIAILHLVKKTASKYFTVDDPNFDEGGADAGANSSQMIAGARCAVCGTFATKHCAGCKTVRYCSAACQSKHWRTDHKLICKKLKLNASRRENASGNKPRTELQQLKKVLFPYEEFVRLFNWENQGFPPCGLLNCGNSCFANVVLQCLSCTRPLVAYLLERGHQRECRRNDWCFLCELQSHVERARILRPFSPINILSRLPNIGGNLGYGKQEDAHEFMRFAIDTMQSVCLDEFGGEKALHSSSQETTVIQYTFGGYLQSQVTCTKCKKISDRYENMMDLTVEIQGDAESLEECLDQFTAEEWLDGENMYKCDGCNDYVKACKRLTIHMAPNILTIALKRFQSGRYGKLNKRVTFPETLDLRPYMSKPGDGTDLYQLYAVVVHVDMLNASFFGHYICYMKDFCGNWYRVDDCKVMTVELEEVLAQGAYMLLYNRMSVRPPCVNLLETLGKEDKHPGEVVKEAELCLPETLKPPVAIEGSIISITEGDMVSDLGYLAEESVSKEDSLRMDLDSSTDNNDKVKSSSQDAIDMDVDKSIEVDPMSDRVDQVDLALGNRDPSSLESNGSCDNENLALRNPDLSALESNGFDDDEKLDYRVTVSASSAENFHSGISGSVPPSVVTPWTGVHSLECDEVKSIPQDSLPTDLEESIEVNPMSARGGKVELGLGSPECSPSDSKSSGDDEKQHSHTVRTASSANHFQCREDSLPLTELIPSPSYHNFTGVERINNEEFMPPEISLDTCLSGQTDVQEIASCSLPPSSETGILHERNPSNFQSLPNPMAEQAIMVEPIKIEGRTSKLPKGNSFSEVKLKPVFSSGFLNNQTKCGSANVTRKVPERCGEGGLVKVGNNCNGFTKVGVVADENVSKVNGHNKFSDYDSLPNCGSIDNKPESCLNGGQIMDRDLGDDGCIGSCRVVEMASPAKLLLERVESSDVECTSGGRNGSWKSCEETMPPECNGFSPNESNNENDRTCYMDPVGASASDTEMLDKPNLGLEMATVESGNVFHPLRVSSEENGNYSCSKMTLNPPPPPIVEDDSQMEFGEVGHVSKAIDSNGLANSGVHLKSIHIYDHDKGPSEGGNAKKSVCNGNGWKPVNICESKKTSQKGYLSRGFLDKPQKKLVKKDDGYENEKIRNSNLTQEAVLEDRNSVFSPGFLDKPLLRKKLPEQRIESLGGTKETFVSDQERNKMPWVVEH